MESWKSQKKLALIRKKIIFSHKTLLQSMTIMLNSTFSSTRICHNSDVVHTWRKYSTSMIQQCGKRDGGATTGMGKATFRQTSSLSASIWPRFNSEIVRDVVLLWPGTVNVMRWIRKSLIKWFQFRNNTGSDFECGLSQGWQCTALSTSAIYFVDFLDIFTNITFFGSKAWWASADFFPGEGKNYPWGGKNLHFA